MAEPGGVGGVSTVTPTFPKTVMDMPNLSTDSSAATGENERTFKESIGHAAYEEAGVAPADVDVAEVYDLSTALELDWYENIGLCAPGEAEALLHSGATTLGGRVPVNPSGGLACFGEAIPAQAIAQVCELTWQVRGEAGDRHVPAVAVFVGGLDLQCGPGGGHRQERLRRLGGRGGMGARLARAGRVVRAVLEVVLLFSNAQRGEHGVGLRAARLPGLLAERNDGDAGEDADQGHGDQDLDQRETRLPHAGTNCSRRATPCRLPSHWSVDCA